MPFENHTVITRYTEEEGVRAITLPPNTVAIEKEAFMDCTRLESITLPQSLRTIADSAFAGCTGLKHITLPEGLERIGVAVFEGCSSLKSIILPSTVKTIDSCAFRCCTALESVLLPEGLKTIAYEAFAGCRSLKLLRIPAGTESLAVRFLGPGGFGPERAITEVEVAPGNRHYRCEDGLLCELAEGRLLYCSLQKAGDLILPPTVRKIASCAFTGCTKLTSITFPESVTEIAEPNFYGQQLTLYGKPDTVVDWCAKYSGTRFGTQEACDC